jgi:uncharacterized protein YaiE (UPF0345 family)
MSKIALSGNASGTGTFTIASPNSNSDRTLTLPDNSGTMVTTASTAAVTQSMLETLVVPIGVGQTWTDVRASRAAATTYTNSTGRPIMVSVVAGAATYSYCSGFVDGVMITEQQSRDSATTTSQAGVIFIVPAGSTYRVEVNVNGSTTDMDTWFELR